MDDRICFPYEDDMQEIPELVNDMKQVYDRMLDETSRDIFVHRLLLSFTENYRYMRNVILYTEGGIALNAVLNKNEKPQYIYGVGRRGKRLVELFPEHNWGGFIDRDSKKDGYYNIEVLDLENFKKRYTSGTVVFVSNMLETDDIVKTLLAEGILAEDIFVLNDFNLVGSKDMYFTPECIDVFVEKEKAFVDIGCYDGKDSLNYMSWCSNMEAKIYAFEPDEKNYKVCKENLGSYSNIELFRVALSDQEQEIGIMGTGEMAYVGEGGDQKIYTKRLDDMIPNDSVGFIKIDVEGHEVNVLKGAKRIISSQCPVLAVSLYHKRSDIWVIPKLLLNYNKNYKFYLRYYGAANGDTVLYAVHCKN